LLFRHAGVVPPHGAQPVPQCAAFEVVSTQIPPHAVWPATHVKQSVLAALQPFAQLIVVAAHVPEPLQVAALVFVFELALHDAAAPHGVPIPTFPVSLHSMLPVVQDVVPVLHGLVGGWQG
jgi:hypothetical protein